MHSVLMAWADYMYTGNADLIKRNYDTIRAKTLVPLARSDGLITTQTGLLTPEVMASIHFNGKTLIDIVDWPHGTPPGGLTRAPEGFGPGGETDDYVFVPVNTVVNAFHYRALTLMGRIAEVAAPERVKIQVPASGGGQHDQHPKGCDDRRDEGVRAAVGLQ